MLFGTRTFVILFYLFARQVRVVRWVGAPRETLQDRPRRRLGLSRTFPSPAAYPARPTRPIVEQSAFGEVFRVPAWEAKHMRILMRPACWALLYVQVHHFWAKLAKVAHLLRADFAQEAPYE